MSKDIKDIAWENCKECTCGEEGCHPNNHRLCGICGNQSNMPISNRKIMYGAHNNRNSKYGWNADHKTPLSKGGTNKNLNLRAVHITCNEKRKDN